MLTIGDGARSDSCKRYTCSELNYEMNLLVINSVSQAIKTAAIGQQEGIQRQLVASTLALFSVASSVQREMRRYGAKALWQSSVILGLRARLQQVHKHCIRESADSVFIRSKLDTLGSKVNDLNNRRRILDCVVAECVQQAQELKDLRGNVQQSLSDLSYCRDETASLKLHVDHLTYELNTEEVRFRAHLQRLVRASRSSGDQVVMNEQSADVCYALLPGVLRAIGDALLSHEREKLRECSLVGVEADRHQCQTENGVSPIDLQKFTLWADSLQYHASSQLDATSVLLHQVHVDRSLKRVHTDLNHKVERNVLDRMLELRYSEMLKYFLNAVATRH